MSYQPPQMPGQGGVPGQPAQPGQAPQPAWAPAPAPAQPVYPTQAPQPAASWGTQPGAPAAPAAPAGASPRNTKAIIGAAIAAVGIIAGLALVFTAGSTREETIKQFARAPVGCTTTLQFDRTGTYTFYVETRGSVPNLGGDCAGSGGSYQHAGEAPSVRLTLVDAAGVAVSLEGEGEPSYDEGAYAGDAHVTAQIVAVGTYQLTVESEATDIAIAVGGDPDADASTQTTTGIAIAVVGALVGGLLLALGMRKKAPPAAAPAAPSWPGGPSVPGYQPAAPQPMQQPVAPSYTPPQQYPPQQQYPAQPPQQYPQQPQAPQAPTAAPPPASPWGTPPQQQ